MKTLIPCLFLALSTLSIASEVIPSKIIKKGFYGDDNRVKIVDLNPKTYATVINNSASVLAQVSNWKIKDLGSVISVTAKDTRTGLSLCEEERFLDEPMVASCTAFLVAPDLIMTAGHCVESEEQCKEMTWVLDYDSGNDFMGPEGTVEFPKSSTYKCAGLVSRSKNTTGIDYSLVKLDRKITDRAPLKLRRTGKVAGNEVLYVLGHPLGLPKMVSTNALITENSQEFYFKTNADTFAGNSGSPVIGKTSGLVEGMLIRGSSDFYLEKSINCNRPVKCTDNTCKGEAVQRAVSLPIN